MKSRFLIYLVVIVVAVGGGVWYLDYSGLLEPERGMHAYKQGPPPPSKPFEVTEEIITDANDEFSVESSDNNAPLAHKGTGADWPQFNGKNRDNKSDETGLRRDWPADGPPLLWTAHGVGDGYSTVAAVNGVVYTMGNKGKCEAVIALDAGTGEKIWSTPIAWASQLSAGPGPRSTPTVSSDAVYAMGGNGDLACLEAASGKVRWQKNILTEFGGGVPGWGICESVLVDDGRVICTPGGTDATVVALDPQSGDVIWKTLLREKDHPGYASPTFATIGDVKQYIQFTASGTIGVRADDGKFLWRENSAANPSANCSSPLVAGDLVFSASNYGVGGACVKLTPKGDKVSAELLYQAKEMKSHHGDMVIVNDLVFGTNESILVCLDLKTGDLKWRNRSVGKGAITYADNRLYLRGENGKVALIEPSGEGYIEHAKFDQPHRSTSAAWPHPVIAHGRLFLRDQDVLLCYDVRAEAK